MRITWLGHSCFCLETGGFSLVLDPYSDGAVPGLAPLRAKADAVFCSHDHRDHGARDKVELSGRECSLAVETIDVFHDDRRGALRGENRIHIVSDGVVRVAHLGDLGHIPEAEEIEKLRGLDAVFIPVGGHYTINAKTAGKLCRLIKPRVIFPMHYRRGDMGYKEISTLAPFTLFRRNVKRYDTNTFELTAATAPQTAVLTYRPE